MTKRLPGYLFCILVLIMSCTEERLPSVRNAEDSLWLTNAEEYAVIVAVLFPTESDSGNSTAEVNFERKTYTRLDGITGNDYRLNRLTIQGKITDNSSVDQTTIADYNHRNEKSYRLDEKRLLPLIPEEGMVILVTPGGTETMEEGIIADGTTYISRPGFNQDRTKAILQINHVAGPEMGVGYEVYLEKASSNGNWQITGLNLNRIY